jgi:hypothetical protein
MRPEAQSALKAHWAPLAWGAVHPVTMARIASSAVCQ